MNLFARDLKILCCEDFKLDRVISCNFMAIWHVEFNLMFLSMIDTKTLSNAKEWSMYQ